MALWIDTGYGERDCQRYAAGTVKPPSNFIRNLLRSANGWTWLCVLMDGASPSWWIELKQMRRMVEAMKANQ